LTSPGHCREAWPRAADALPDHPGGVQQGSFASCAG
jgi:hypothetical protein